MIVFDLSVGVGAQVQNYELENNHGGEEHDTEIPELMCDGLICEKTNRLPAHTPSDSEVPIQEYGWWYDYWNDHDENGMDDDLQMIIDGQKDSQSMTSIVGIDGRNTVAIIIHYAWHPGQSDIEKVKSVLKKYEWDEETSWFMPMEILDNIVLDHVPVTSLVELWSLEGVVLVEQQNVLVPYLDKATKGSKVRSSGLYTETMRELNYDGSGVVIAILDTGVDNEHFSLDDFSDNNNDNTNDPNDLEDPKWVAGCDATSFTGNSCSTDGDNDPDDGDGHGTHVAGIALGTGDSDRENQGYAPGAYLVDVKVMTDAGGSNSQSILQGIQWATQNVETDWGNNDSSVGIDIMSMSFGSASSPTGNDDAGDNGTSAEAQAVNQAANAGIICIAAIGNDGQRRVTSVGAADKAITIGSIDDKNSIDRNDDTVASYSNSGPRESDNDGDLEDELKPWVVAPGSGIISAEHAQSTSIIPGSENNRARDGYTSKDGTSMSTPAVAGLVAIMLEIGISEGLMEYKDSENTEKIKQYLMKYSENKGAESEELNGYSWNTQYGFGIIDGSLIMRGMFGDSDGGGGSPPTDNETGPGEGSGNWVEIENPVDGECEYDPANTNTLVCKSWVIEGETYRIRGNIDQGDNNGSVDQVLAQISYKYKPKDNQPTREDILLGWHIPETIMTGNSISNWSTTISIPEFSEDEIDASQIIVRVAAKSEFGQWSNVTRSTYGVGLIDFILESPSGQNELIGTIEIQGRYESVNGCTVQWRLGTDEWENAVTIGGNGYSYTTQDSKGRNVVKTGLVKDSGNWAFDWDSSTVADGTHRISVRMISGNGVMSEEVRKQIIVDNIPPSPDLIFRSSALSIEEFGVPISEVYVNTFLEIRGSIRNVGDIAANEVGIILEEDGARRDEYVIPKIDSGEIVEITLYWNPAASGERQIEIIIDPINTIQESDETNNRLSENFPVIPRPNGVDLAIRDSAIKTIPEIPRPNEQFVLEVRVDNLGSDDAFDVDAFLEIKTDKGWVQVANNDINRVAGQGSIQVSFLYIPNMSGVLEIRIDISGQFADLDWSNNIFETILLIDKSTLTGPRNLNFKVGEVPLEIIDMDEGGIIITQRESTLYLYKLTQSKNIVQCNNILEEMWSGEISVEIDEDNIAHLSWTRRYLDNNGYYKQTLTYSTIDSSCQMTPIQDLMPPILLSDGKYWGIDMDKRDTEIIISGYHQDIFAGGSFQESTDIFLLYSDLPISSADWSVNADIVADIDISSSSDNLEIEFGIGDEIHLLYQENRDDATGIERLGLWYAHGELNDENWAFKKAVGDKAALPEMIVIVENEDDKIISCWREGSLDESEIVCIIGDSSFRAIDGQLKSFPARGLRNIDFVESERGIQVYFDGVGPTGPQFKYGLINFDDGWLGISDRLGDGKLHTSTKSPSSTETLILHTSNNGWQIRSLIDDAFSKNNDISALDWFKIQLGLSNNDQEFRILIIGVSVTVLILCIIIIATMSTQGMKWVSEKRKKRIKSSVKLEDDVIDVIEEDDLMISSAEIDSIELISEDDPIDNKKSRRLRRISRMEKDQKGHAEVFSVKITDGQEIKDTIVNNNQIICHTCNSKFEIIIGISSIRCPVCQERIDL
jgi:subtilisin family serine protease